MEVTDRIAESPVVTIIPGRRSAHYHPAAREALCSTTIDGCQPRLTPSDMELPRTCTGAGQWNVTPRLDGVAALRSRSGGRGLLDVALWRGRRRALHALRVGVDSAVFVLLGGLGGATSVVLPVGPVGGVVLSGAAGAPRGRDGDARGHVMEPRRVEGARLARRGRSSADAKPASSCPRLCVFVAASSWIARALRLNSSSHAASSFIRPGFLPPSRGSGRASARGSPRLLPDARRDIAVRALLDFTVEGFPSTAAPPRPR